MVVTATSNLTGRSHSSRNNRFEILTNKQKRLVLHLLVDPSYDIAAKRMRISKRSVYRLAANIRNRLASRDEQIIKHIVGG